jgi:hypothetical protein
MQRPSFLATLPLGAASALPLLGRESFAQTAPPARETPALPKFQPEGAGKFDRPDVHAGESQSLSAGQATLSNHHSRFCRQGGQALDVFRRDGRRYAAAGPGANPADGASDGSFGRYECIEHRMGGATRVYAAASEMRADAVAIAY